LAGAWQPGSSRPHQHQHGCVMSGRRQGPLLSVPASTRVCLFMPVHPPRQPCCCQDRVHTAGGTMPTRLYLVTVVHGAFTCLRTVLCKAGCPAGQGAGYCLVTAMASRANMLLLLLLLPLLLGAVGQPGCGHPPPTIKRETARSRVTLQSGRTY